MHTLIGDDGTLVQARHARSSEDRYTARGDRHTGHKLSKVPEAHVGLEWTFFFRCLSLQMTNVLRIVREQTAATHGRNSSILECGGSELDCTDGQL